MKKSPEVPHGAVVRVRRRRFRPREVECQTRRDEVDREAVGGLTRATQRPSVAEPVHRKPLMLQQLPDPDVDVLAELTDRQLRRSVEHERRDTGEHGRQRL